MFLILTEHDTPDVLKTHTENIKAVVFIQNEEELTQSTNLLDTPN